MKRAEEKKGIEAQRAKPLPPTRAMDALIVDQEQTRRGILLTSSASAGLSTTRAIDALIVDQEQTGRKNLLTPLTSAGLSKDSGPVHLIHMMQIQEQHNNISNNFLLTLYTFKFDLEPVLHRWCSSPPECSIRPSVVSLEKHFLLYVSYSPLFDMIEPSD